MSFRHSQRVFQYCKAYLAPGRRVQPCQHLSSADRSHVTGYAMEQGFIYPGPRAWKGLEGGEHQVSKQCLHTVFLGVLLALQQTASGLILCFMKRSTCKTS